jgi:hypothetical protein
MKTVLFAAAATLLFLVCGCQHHNVVPRQCRSCGTAGGPAHVGQVQPGYFDDSQAAPGPPTASYAYPYYTLRAPRDFLRDNPPSIGL